MLIGGHGYDPAILLWGGVPEQDTLMEVVLSDLDISALAHDALALDKLEVKRELKWLSEDDHCSCSFDR